jgi:hypothetical protein
MIKRLISLSILFNFLLLLFLIITLPSCTKDSDKTASDEKTNGVVSEFSESDEDLLAVDYSYFYNELSPHGEWIEVSAADLGIDMKKTSEQGSIWDDLIGIKTANAQDLGMFFVWRPSPDLAVSVTAGQPPAYTPYNNGQWLYTDAGWYFQAGTPHEDLTCHYGRWAYDPQLGWVWLPGRVWAPSWVEWRENDDYIAWAPVPPGVYIQNNAISHTVINENRYTIVEKRHFIEPSVYKYKYHYVENKNKIMIKEMIKTDGVMIKNKTVINKGPEAGAIEKSSGKKIEIVKIKKTGKKDETGYAGNEISVYTPEFKKSDKVKNEPVSKPEKRVSFKDAEKVTGGQKDELKEKDKTGKKEQKEMKKEEKGKQKEDKGMKEEKEKKKDDKSQGKEKKDKSDKENKDKGNKKSGDDNGKNKKDKNPKGKK